jgi:D-alanine-D-alanine ligase
VIGALDPDEFEITAIGITREGRLATGDQVRQMLPPALHGRIAPAGALEAAGSPLRLAAAGAGRGRNPHPPPEVIFPLLHGPYGEDGTIQGLLETAGIPYVGCGVLASAVGMDKDVMKRLFREQGLPVAPYVVCRSAVWRERLPELRRVAGSDFGYPVFSKPANLGSSVGVRKIHSERELEAGLAHAAQFDRKILLEKGIDAREIECAVLGNDAPEASVVGEVVSAREFYDYAAKYRDPASRLEIPARLPAEKAEEVRRLSLEAFRAIDGAGLARVDFFLERGTGAAWVNEINTMPGFTPISMYAKLWAASGLTFGALVRRLIDLGLERHHERRSRRVSSDD